jgi:starvation-inducible DNA-binding protein
MKIGIGNKDLNKSIAALTSVLANEMILYTKTRNFHWNVSGPSFMEIHELFESQYDELELMIDEVAERVMKLGGRAIGTMQEFLDHTTLNDTTKANDRDEMISELLVNHEQVISELRDLIIEISETNDFGTVDFLTGLTLKHETNAWKLRKYLN